MEQKIVEAVMTGLTTIAVTLIGYIAARINAYLEKKNLKGVAVETYYLIEQQYKGVENAANAKRTAFDQYLLAKIPGLTQAELDHLRESICGEINTQLKNKKLE